MTDILKRIDALLARAGSPELEEARTSAWAAAKLIREHKVILRLPNDMQPVTAPNPFGGASPFVDLVSDFVRVVAFGDCEECGTRILRKELSAEGYCPKCWTDKFKKRDGRTARTTQHEAKWRRIEARHAGLCEHCGIRTKSGETVMHKKGTGVRHTRCPEQASP